MSKTQNNNCSEEELSLHTPDSGTVSPTQNDLAKYNTSPHIFNSHIQYQNYSGSNRAIPFYGYFNDPENDIIEDIPEILNGKALPRVLVPNDMWETMDIKDNSEVWQETFCIPARMGGVLIGRFGKNVRELRNQWQAEFSLNMFPGQQDILLFKISCPIIHKKNVLQWIERRFRMKPSKTPIGNPNQLRRFLPLGMPTPVIVRSCYGLKEMFVTIKDAECKRFYDMQKELDADYSTLIKFRMQLCEPVTSGTVAIVPHDKGFSRALIIKIFDLYPKYALYFLLDHGTFGVIALNEIRKIRAKYMLIPFQTVHVSWAHACPIYSDMPDWHLLREYFSSERIHAHAVRMETCCKSSVVFLKASSLPQTQPKNMFTDILEWTWKSGLFTISPMALYPNKQQWLNSSKTPYYTYPYSGIDYESLVGFMPEDEEEDASLITEEQDGNNNTAKKNDSQKTNPKAANGVNGGNRRENRKNFKFGKNSQVNKPNKLEPVNPIS